MVLLKKLARYLCCILKQLREEQTEATGISIDNLSVLEIINDNYLPTECTPPTGLRFFSIQDWREAGDIILKHIPRILNPSDDMSNPFGWVLHASHYPCIMGHYGYIIITCFEYYSSIQWCIVFIIQSYLSFVHSSCMSLALIALFLYLS